MMGLIVLRGSDDVAAICMWCSRVSVGQAGGAPAFGCLANSSRDCSGRRGFGGVSSGWEWVNKSERVLGRHCRFLANVLGF